MRAQVGFGDRLIDRPGLQVLNSHTVNVNVNVSIRLVLGLS